MAPGGTVGYEQIRVMDELSRSVQRAGGVSLQRQETLGELVKSIAAQRGICRPKDLISEEPTRHEVRVGDQSLYTYCFMDALMLPFVFRDQPVEVHSTSPDSG